MRLFNSEELTDEHHFAHRAKVNHSRMISAVVSVAEHPLKMEETQTQTFCGTKKQVQSMFCGTTIYAL